MRETSWELKDEARARERQYVEHEEAGRRRYKHFLCPCLDCELVRQVRLKRQGWHDADCIQQYGRDTCDCNYGKPARAKQVQKTGSGKRRSSPKR